MTVEGQMSISVRTSCVNFSIAKAFAEQIQKNLNQEIKNGNYQFLRSYTNLKFCKHSIEFKLCKGLEVGYCEALCTTKDTERSEK